MRYACRRWRSKICRLRMNVAAGPAKIVMSCTSASVNPPGLLTATSRPRTAPSDTIGTSTTESAPISSTISRMRRVSVRAWLLRYGRPVRKFHMPRCSGFTSYRIRRASSSGMPKTGSDAASVRVLAS